MYLKYVYTIDYWRIFFDKISSSKYVNLCKHMFHVKIVSMCTRIMIYLFSLNGAVKSEIILNDATISFLTFKCFFLSFWGESLCKRIKKSCLRIPRGTRNKRNKQIISCPNHNQKWCTTSLHWTNHFPPKMQYYSEQIIPWWYNGFSSAYSQTRWHHFLNHHLSVFTSRFKDFQPDMMSVKYEVEYFSRDPRWVSCE